MVLTCGTINYHTMVVSIAFKTYYLQAHAVHSVNLCNNPHCWLEEVSSLKRRLGMGDRLHQNHRCDILRISCIFLSSVLRRKNILGNSHENAEELERSTEMKEKEAAL